MNKMLLLFLLPAVLICSRSYSQKRYGYAVLYLRCGNSDPARDRVYYSPVIELNRLNFDKFTQGVDPGFPPYSVRYYTFAIDKWFEMYLKEKYQVAVNDPEKYERNATSVVFDNKNNGDCNTDKSDPGCFFTDKQKLVMHRNNAISESKLAKHAIVICEVIDLKDQ